MTMSFCVAAAMPAQALDKMLANGTTQPLSAAELGDLGDIFFQRVISATPQPDTFSKVVAAIQPDPTQRRVFVVSEEIAKPSTQGQQRRSVIGFEGNAAGTPLKPNVMISVNFAPSGYPEDPSLIEAWGWDVEKGRYNYYSREAVGGTKQWFFHGSSDDVSKPESERGRCLDCHRSGAPVMKELFFPWNNWHGPRFRASYLEPATPQHWAVADSGVVHDSLTTADKLEENFIEPSIVRFNQSRLRKGTEALAGTRRRVPHAQTLLAPLFRNTEFNLITSPTESGKHPLSPTIVGKPGAPVAIPNSFFLNADLIGGHNRVGITGLGITEANTFATSPELLIQPSEYANLVASSGEHIVDRSVEPPRNLGGDAIFAGLTPEPSFLDNEFVDLLLQEGAVTPQFVAAVMSVDLRSPLFSKDREALLGLVPEAFEYDALRGAAPNVGASEHQLTKAVIDALEAKASSGALSAAETQFLARLKAPDPVALLKQDVVAYLAELKTKLDPANAQARRAGLSELHQKVIDRRKAVSRFPIIESEFLLPLN